MPLKNSWIFPVVQSIHLCGIALLVGSIVIVDLRRLGYVLRHETISEVARRFDFWTRTGFVIIFATGPILFGADLPRYIHNPAFLFKMSFLVLALIFHFTVQTRTHKDGKLVGLISILLWSCVVLGGRAIADFDI
jgi:hypothetical protein